MLNKSTSCHSTRECHSQFETARSVQVSLTNSRLHSLFFQLCLFLLFKGLVLSKETHFSPLKTEIPALSKRTIVFSDSLTDRARKFLWNPCSKDYNKPRHILSFVQFKIVSGETARLINPQNRPKSPTKLLDLNLLDCGSIIPNTFQWRLKYFVIVIL